MRYMSSQLTQPFTHLSSSSATEAQVYHRQYAGCVRYYLVSSNAQEYHSLSRSCLMRAGQRGVCRMPSLLPAHHITDLLDKAFSRPLHISNIFAYLPGRVGCKRTFNWGQYPQK